jgi:hypothetical protein
MEKSVQKFDKGSDVIVILLMIDITPAKQKKILSSFSPIFDLLWRLLSSTIFYRYRCTMESDGVDKKRKTAEHETKRKKRQKATSQETIDKKLPLSGLAFAITTLDIKGQRHSDDSQSYKEVVAILASLGGKATGQVHKGLTGLICNPSAVRQRTQRVRKAIKRGLPLISVDFLHGCQQANALLSLGEFELKVEDLSEEECSTVKDDTGRPYGAEIADSQWTEPVSLGCCCVCHENGDNACPWCDDCDTNKQSKDKRKISKKKKMVKESE